MFNCKATPTPVITGLKLSKDDEGSIIDPTLFKRIVGSLLYGVSLISRFMESPKECHWKAGKIIIRYFVPLTYLIIILPAFQ